MATAGGPLNEAGFRALGRKDRVLAVKRDGEFLGTRVFGGYHVHLYRMPGFFAEVWMRIGIGTVDFAEVVTDQDILLEYVPDLDLRP